MTITNKAKLVLAASLLWAGPTCAAGSGRMLLELKPESTLWLEGDSTLHTFSSTATLLGGAIELTRLQDALGDAVKNGQVSRLDINIPVRSLKSGESKLDKNMQAALKAPDFPLITFRMSRYGVTSVREDPDALAIKATGQLSIAGKERTIDLEAQGQLSADRLLVRGKKEILMTDYGIKPPTFLGMLKTKDKVVVHFDLLIGPKDTQDQTTLDKRRVP